jgi:hypothetical protein
MQQGTLGKDALRMTCEAQIRDQLSENGDLLPLEEGNTPRPDYAAWSRKHRVVICGELSYCTVRRFQQ